MLKINKKWNTIFLKQGKRHQKWPHTLEKKPDDTKMCNFKTKTQWMSWMADYSQQKELGACRYEKITQTAA